MAEVIFVFNGEETLIQCKPEDKLRDICEKFCSKIKIDINRLIFKYGEGIVNLELAFNEVPNEIDKKNFLLLLVYRNEINVVYKTEEKGKQRIFGKVFVEIMKII